MQAQSKQKSKITVRGDDASLVCVMGLQGGIPDRVYDQIQRILDVAHVSIEGKKTASFISFIPDDGRRVRVCAAEVTSDPKEGAMEMVVLAGHAPCVWNPAPAKRKAPEESAGVGAAGVPDDGESAEPPVKKAKQ